MKAAPIFLILCLLGTVSAPASAERADRDKPVNLEADRITVDDAKKVHVFEGNVQLVQGTLTIRCDKLVVTQDAEGFQKGVATGGPDGLARFRQKREGTSEYIEGEAETIVHDAKLQKTELFRRAQVKSGQDEVRGQYISYDGRTENYVVSSGPGGTVAQGSRVRAVIQPKNSDRQAAQSKPESQAKPPPQTEKSQP